MGGGGDGTSNRQYLDPLKLLLGEGGNALASDEPLVICIVDEFDSGFVAIVETMVKRLYREKVSGMPNATRFEDVTELANESRWVKAQGSIFSVKFEEAEWNKLEGDGEQNEAWERIWNNRIQNELFSQGFGALIFNRQIVSSPDDHSPKIISLQPPTPSQTVQARFIRLFCGCLAPGAVESNTTFGQVFNQHSERVVEERWKTIESSENYRIWDATKPDGNESLAHRRIKVFVVKTLVKRLREQGYELETPLDFKRVITTEETVGDTDGANVRPDVVCDDVIGTPSGGFEIETLFAQGKSGVKPRDKLRRAFKKYEQIDGVERINIVLDNLSVMLHLQTLSQLKVAHEDWEDEFEKDIQFFTLDVLV